MTLSTGAAIGASPVANMPDPTAPVVLIVLFSLSFLTAQFLPKPGHFLPAVKKTSANTSVLVDPANRHAVVIDQVDALVKTPSLINSFNGRAMPFNKVYAEIKQGVQRPRLNETSTDPNLLMHLTNASQLGLTFQHNESEYPTTANKHSKLLENWFTNDYL
jgi:hypothetical protein